MSSEFVASPLSAPVFVIAPARSGTTALSHLIARDLDLRCSPETNVMGILDRIGRDHRTMTFEAFQHTQHKFLMHGANRPYSILFPRSLLHRRILDAPRAFAEALISADHYTEGRQILEQTPRNGEHATALRWLFPEALLLFLIRNPFDVIQSNRATPWGSSNVALLFALWARQYVEVARLARYYGRQRLMLVRYEKLASQSYREGLLRRLERAGIARRAEPIEITPHNFERSDWADGHFSRTVQPFAPQQNTKWSRRYPYLGRLGAGLCLVTLQALRRPSGQGRGFGWRLMQLAAILTAKVLKR